MTVTVIDNFLDQQEFVSLQEFFLGGSMPWYTTTILLEKDAKDSNLSYQDNFQLFNLMYSNYSPQSDLIFKINPLIKKINPVAIVRIKANLNPRTSKIVEHGYHIDYRNLTTCIYYLNTNDGYTLFEDGTKIESKENRLVEFNSNLSHTGTSTTNSPFRVVLNLNYIK